MDELTLARAKRGDPEAFESLMKEYEALVWRVCWHYTGNREDASDCGQEAMVKIWRNLESYRGECAFSSWVYRIAANCCLDWLRKKKRDRSVSVEPMREQGFDPPDEAPGPEEQTLEKDKRRRIREAIAALPEDQRDVLVLTQLEGKSYEEAARMLGTAEGTVKSRLNRARSRLKELLSDGETGEQTREKSVRQNERRGRT